MGRLYNLDYLRGMAAFGIMIFHYLSWSIGAFGAETFMGRVGIYGVSIFYVLSGLTLYYVYYSKMKPSAEDLYQFAKKRIFRIFPLLWLVTITAILLSGKMPSLRDVFLNLTGLFGFVKWNVYFSAGVWSIGNELVFYVFFPFFVLFAKSFKPVLVLVAGIIFAIYFYFAFFKLSPDVILSEQWRNYVNPLNQVFLFLGGFLIGLLFHKVEMKNFFSFVFLLVGMGLIFFYPAHGDTVQLVTGIPRLIFTASCFLICLGFYKLSIKLPVILHRPLTFLGEASYSVYLVHPIVYTLSGLAWRA